MREAHRSVPPLALPTGPWRDRDPAQVPPVAMGGPLDLLPPSRGNDLMQPVTLPASRPTPPATVGAPIQINQPVTPSTRPPAQTAPQPRPARTSREADNSLLPPATVGSGASRGTGEKNFLDKLFGG